MAEGGTGEALPEGLGEADLDEIRALVRAALERLGKRVTRVGRFELAAEDGLRCFITNLARNCAGADRASWPGMAEHYAKAMVDGKALREDLLSDDEFFTMIRARVLSPQYWTNGNIRKPSYTRPLDPSHPATSPVVALCLDLPNTVATLSDAEFGKRDIEAAWTRGLANTMAELVDKHLRFVVAIGEGEEAEQVEGMEQIDGNSFHTASKILDIPALSGGRDLSGGALFAIPHRHTILLHLPKTRREAENALQVIAAFAQDWTDAAGSVSPEVFSWKDGVYHQLTTRDGDAACGYRVDITDPFFVALP